MSVTAGSPPFEAITSFAGREATVTLRGSIESTAAVDLEAVLDAAIERRPTSMVLDLANLDFMGAAGLVAVSNAERRLAALDVRLLVQSPSALVNRLLTIMELAEERRLERALPGHGHLGSEQLGDLTPTSQGFSVSAGTGDPRRITAMPADSDVVDGALRLIVELARTSIEAADGVSVSLSRHGVLSTVAASNQTIMAMDADQYATGEGPCVDASVKGHWFHAESLDTETRWPAFTPRARELGIKAILSSPLRAFEKPVGALNIYSLAAQSFEIKDQVIAADFAHRASVILSDAHAGVSDAPLALRFQEALRSREVIALAKGIITEREGIDEDHAFSALLRLSLYQGVPLRERAVTMVHSAQRPQLGPEWGLDD